MKLSIKHVNMRGGYKEQLAWKTEVVDEETGSIVGWVHAERSPSFRLISLFDGKYQAEFSSNRSDIECDAFAKGVEAVLNHMTKLDGETGQPPE